MSELLKLAERCEAAVMPFRDGYAVTEDGEIWSEKRGSWTRLKPTLNSRGYFKLTLIIDGRRADLRLNRIIAEAFHGPPPTPDSVARHLDDDRSNNHWLNIAWGSQSDNVMDAIRNGRSDPAANGRAGAVKISADRNHAAKLTWEIVDDIRRRAASGENNCEIARSLGLGWSNVSLVVRGKAWKEAHRAELA